MPFTPRTAEELEAEGYKPVSAEDAGKLRLYGVPIVQSGMIHLKHTRFRWWAPGWAKTLLKEWPLDSTTDDYDHFTLKRVIRLIARTGDVERVDAFLTVARLGGESAVQKMLLPEQDEENDTCGS